MKAVRKTPVLMIIYNRPDTTQEVFDQVRAAKPEKLYIAADGPRPGVGGELEQCKKARAIVQQIDWPCTVKTLFREQNVGCRFGLITALDWALEENEDCIILEDDCVPSLSFFGYCEELLDRYRHAERIFMISGDNFLLSEYKPKESYYFSKYNFIWGWATWRRAWKHFDRSMTGWSEEARQNWSGTAFLKKREKQFWWNVYDVAKSDKIGEWGLKWAHALHSNNALSICPATNLVTNIGGGLMATHTKSNFAIPLDLPLKEIEFPLTHPQEILGNTKADAIAFQNFYGPFTLLRKLRAFLVKLSRILSADSQRIQIEQMYSVSSRINKCKIMLFKIIRKICSLEKKYKSRPFSSSFLNEPKK